MVASFLRVKVLPRPRAGESLTSTMHISRPASPHGIDFTTVVSPFRSCRVISSEKVCRRRETEGGLRVKPGARQGFCLGGRRATRSRSRMPAGGVLSSGSATCETFVEAPGDAKAGGEGVNSGNRHAQTNPVAGGGQGHRHEDTPTPGGPLSVATGSRRAEFYRHQWSKGAAVFWQPHTTNTWRRATGEGRPLQRSAYSDCPCRCPQTSTSQTSPHVMLTRRGDASSSACSGSVTDPIQVFVATVGSDVVSARSEQGDARSQAPGAFVVRDRKTEGNIPQLTSQLISTTRLSAD